MRALFHCMVGYGISSIVYRLWYIVSYRIVNRNVLVPADVVINLHGRERSVPGRVDRELHVVQISNSAV